MRALNIWCDAYTGKLIAEAFITKLKAFMRNASDLCYSCSTVIVPTSAKIVTANVQSLKGRLELNFPSGYSLDLNSDE